jgi:hypothetical protein
VPEYPYCLQFLDSLEEGYRVFAFEMAPLFSDLVHDLAESAILIAEAGGSATEK